MANPSTIPTSFVPHPEAVNHRGTYFSSSFVVSLFAYGFFVFVFALAIGVFFYGRVLDASLATKDANLAAAQNSIDAATLQSFVQLQNRLNASEQLLSNHIAVSGFFTALGVVLPSNVRFSTLHIAVDTAKNATKVDGAGVAKSLNTLSVASAAFAKNEHIKDVIFSKITINKDGSVSFGFSATVDSKLITFQPTSL